MVRIGRILVQRNPTAWRFSPIELLCILFSPSFSPFSAQAFGCLTPWEPVSFLSLQPGDTTMMWRLFGSRRPARPAQRASSQPRVDVLEERLVPNGLTAAQVGTGDGRRCGFRRCAPGPQSARAGSPPSASSTRASSPQAPDADTGSGPDSRARPGSDVTQSGQCRAATNASSARLGNALAYVRLRQGDRHLSAERCLSPHVDSLPP
jgi:hypothetical protein